MQPFVRAYVAEHRFHHRHPMAVDGFALVTVYPVFHPIHIRGATLVSLSVGHLAAFALTVIRRTRILRALVLLRARSALQ